MDKAWGGCWCSAMAGGHGGTCNLPAGSCPTCPDYLAEREGRLIVDDEEDE